MTPAAVEPSRSWQRASLGEGAVAPSVVVAGPGRVARQSSERRERSPRCRRRPSAPTHVRRPRPATVQSSGKALEAFGVADLRLDDAPVRHQHRRRRRNADRRAVLQGGNCVRRPAEPTAPFGPVEAVRDRPDGRRWRSGDRPRPRRARQPGLRSWTRRGSRARGAAADRIRSCRRRARPSDSPAPRVRRRCAASPRPCRAAA